LRYFKFISAGTNKVYWLCQVNTCDRIEKCFENRFDKILRRDDYIGCRAELIFPEKSKYRCNITETDFFCEVL